MPVDTGGCLPVWVWSWRQRSQTFPTREKERFVPLPSRTRHPGHTSGDSDGRELGKNGHTRLRRSCHKEIVVRVGPDTTYSEELVFGE